MKNGIILLLFVMVSISCSSDKTISEELEGTWLYEREVFSSGTNFDDPDVRGVISLAADETGEWDSDSPDAFNFGFDLEWDLQANDTKIALTRSFKTFTDTIFSTTIYTISRKDEDNFTFTHHIKHDSPIDSIEGFEIFENIILLRID